MSLPDPVDPVATLWAGIGKRVWSLRRDRGMTQQELALKLGLSRASIANLEAGNQRMALGNLYEMARALQVGIAELLEPADQRRSTELSNLRRRNAELENLLVRYRRLVERLDALGDVPLA